MAYISFFIQTGKYYFFSGISRLTGVKSKLKSAVTKVIEDRQRNKINHKLKFEQQDEEREADLDDIRVYLARDDKDESKKNSYSKPLSHY